MSEAAEGTAAAAVAATAPAESLKRELEDPEAGETAAKRPHVDDPAAPADDAAATEPKAAESAEATTEGAAATEAPAETAEVPVAVPDICVRLLMTNKMVGMVIGKGGEKIRRVRETSGCQITFSDNHPGVQDRVLMVTGQHEHVKAAMNVIVVQLEQDVLISNQSAPNPAATNQLTLKLLVPQSQIGAVIGKGGSNLERMRASTGAQIIAATDVLPNSTDRPTSMTGPATAIVACIEACMEIFQNTPLGTQMIQYRPPAPAQYGGYGPQQGGYGGPRGGAPHMGGYAGQQGGPPMGGPQGYPGPQGGPQGGYAPQHHQQPTTMQQFTIANDLVGCVIGRGGSEINAMRKQSGAQIRIHHPENGQTERLVSVSGTQEQVAMAHFLLTNKLQQEVSNNWAPGSGAAPPQQQAPPQQAYY